VKLTVTFSVYLARLVDLSVVTTLCNQDPCFDFDLEYIRVRGSAQGDMI